jgi:ribonuclease P protein component
VASPLAHPRAGLVVPKRGRTAVARNQLKRRLRELVRLHLLPNVQAADFVIRAREQAYMASFDDLQADLAEALERLSRMLR